MLGNVTVKLTAKRVFNFLKLIAVWRVQVGKAKPSYLMAAWFITEIRAYWICGRKIFPYFKLKRIEI